jgi:uncharacterized protein YbaA (DUF1428 family)
MYVDGFLVAVPTANKEKYREHAEKAVPIFKEFGMTRMVECWGDDVPDGKVTDLKRAVKATADETVVFSWCEYPDKETRDVANAKMMSDPRMAEMGDMPFDGKRMIFSGFAPILEKGSDKGRRLYRRLCHSGRGQKAGGLSGGRRGCSPNLYGAWRDRCGRNLGRRPDER